MNAASNVVLGRQHGPWLIGKSGEILNSSKRTGIPLYRSVEFLPARPRVTELGK
jgi:hypothetical protein